VGGKNQDNYTDTRLRSEGKLLFATGSADLPLRIWEIGNRTIIRGRGRETDVVIRKEGACDICGCEFNSHNHRAQGNMCRSCHDQFVTGDGWMRITNWTAELGGWAHQNQMLVSPRTVKEQKHIRAELNRRVKPR
jgi:hypothetical protein